MTAYALPRANHRAADVLDAAARSRTLPGAAAVLGVSESAVARALHRAGRADLLHRLTGPDDTPADLPAIPAHDLGWQDDALCAQTDPEAFFPDKGGSTAAAKRVCGACPVRLACLDYALDTEQRFGIWGGLSERERRRVKRRAV